MHDSDPTLVRIDQVLADEERARRAWLASTTPGADHAAQRLLADAMATRPVLGQPENLGLEADEPQELAACPPRPDVPPVAEQKSATGLGSLLVRLAYTIRRLFR